MDRLESVVMVLRIVFVIVLFMPVIYRYGIKKEPETYRRASMLGIGYALLTNLLLLTIGFCVSLAYHHESGIGTYRSFDLMSANMPLYLMQALGSSVLVLLLFFLARYLFRVGYKQVAELRAEYTGIGKWWNVWWQRWLFFYVYSLVLTYLEAILEILLLPRASLF